MSPQILIAIAELCRATGTTGSSTFYVESAEKAVQRQLACQKDYIICVEASLSTNKMQYEGTALSKCVKEKK